MKLLFYMASFVYIFSCCHPHCFRALAGLLILLDHNAGVIVTTVGNTGTSPIGTCSRGVTVCYSESKK